VPSSGKLYHHKMKLNKLTKESKMEEIMRDVYEKHSAYLDNKKVNPQQIISSFFTIINSILFFFKILKINTIQKF